MTSDKFAWRFFSKVMLLFVVLVAAAFLLVKGWYIYLVLAVPVIIYLLVDFYKYNRKTHDELQQFVESVHYRDFSRYFDVKHAPTEIQPLRQGFNEINTTFKVISKEKETQYQYLQKILELVNTGILSYKADTGEVVWMNETLKKMLQLPYLKTIHSLKRRDEELYNDVVGIRPAESKIATATVDKESFKVLISSTAFNTEGSRFNLIAFQNVNEALDETESKAWQRLLSVMTHEIMNSIAPISSLADTLKQRIQKSVLRTGSETTPADDLEVGIDTIKKRSEGLLKFAQTYRNLNKITTLNLAKVYVRDVFENLLQLMLPTLEQKNIEMDIVLKDTALEMHADINLLEQVLINLIVNAMEAVKELEAPRIVLSAHEDVAGKIYLRVADNGAGMDEEVKDKIFIPFFSTKKSGSGIGLSLCKQIMMLHKGHIQVQSKKGEGTVFILQFNQLQQAKEQWV